MSRRRAWMRGEDAWIYGCAAPFGETAQVDGESTRFDRDSFVDAIDRVHRGDDGISLVLRHHERHEYAGAGTLAVGQGDAGVLFAAHLWPGDRDTHRRLVEMVATGRCGVSPAYYVDNQRTTPGGATRVEAIRHIGIIPPNHEAAFERAWVRVASTAMRSWLDHMLRGARRPGDDPPPAAVDLGANDPPASRRPRDPIS